MEPTDTSANPPAVDAAVSEGWDSVDDTGLTKEPVVKVASAKDEGGEAGADTGADDAASKDGAEDGGTGDEQAKEPTAEEALAALETKGNELLKAAGETAADEAKPPAVDVARLVDEIFSEDATIRGEDDTETSLTQTFKDFPEISFALKTVMTRLTERLIKQGVITVKAEAPTPEKTAATSAEVAELRARQVNAEFWRDVTDERPDARKVANSAEFKAWVGKSSKAIQHLASTPDAQAALMVINAYELATGKKAAPEKAKPAVADPRTLRRSASGARGPAPVPRGKKDPNDFDAGWDET